MDTINHLIRLNPQIQLETKECDYELGYYTFDSLQDIETTELSQNTKNQCYWWNISYPQWQLHLSLTNEELQKLQ